MGLTESNSCTDCPAGKHQPVGGKAVCLGCPAGKFTAIANLKANCTRTICSRGQASPANATTSKDRCADCPQNTYRNESMDVCEDTQCPEGSTSTVGAYSPTLSCQEQKVCATANSIFAKDGTSCVCRSDYYSDSSGSCLECPAHAFCDLQNTTLSSMVIEQGFWRTSTGSAQIWECPKQ